MLIVGKLIVEFSSWISNWCIFLLLEIYHYRSFGVPLFMQINGQSRLSQVVQNEPEEEFYSDDDDSVLEQEPLDYVAEESIMSNEFSF